MHFFREMQPAMMLRSDIYLSRQPHGWSHWLPPTTVSNRSGSAFAQDLRSDWSDTAVGGTTQVH